MHAAPRVYEHGRTLHTTSTHGTGHGQPCSTSLARTPHAAYHKRGHGLPWLVATGVWTGVWTPDSRVWSLGRASSNWSPSWAMGQLESGACQSTGSQS